MTDLTTRADRAEQASTATEAARQEADQRADELRDQLEASRRQADELHQADAAWKTQTTWRRILEALRRG